MTEATYLYASAKNLKRTPEELKKHHARGVPVYEPTLTNDAKDILKFAISSYVTDDVWLEDMKIGCREFQGAKPDYRGTENVRILLCGYDKDGRCFLLDYSFVGWTDLDELAKICENRTEFSKIQLLVTNKHVLTTEDTAKAARLFIKRPLAHDLFLAMREDGRIKAWDA